MKKLLYSLAILLISSTLLYAQGKNVGPLKNVKLEIKTGYHAVGHDDSLSKVGEYEPLSSGGDGSGSLSFTLGTKIGDINFSGHASYFEGHDKDYSAHIDFGRVLDVGYSFESFIHRLDHDELYKDEPKAPSPFPAGFNGVDEMVAINPIWAKENGEVFMHGAQTVAATDTRPGKKYQIFYSEQKAKTKINIPFFPYITPEISFRREKRYGWKQQMYLSGKCTPCHMVGAARRIDEANNDVSAGFGLKFGALSISYKHMWRHFNNDVNEQFANFDVVPGTKAVWADRLLYDGERRPYFEAPDIDKDIDIAKAKFTLPWHTTIFGHVVSSDIQNNFTNNNIDFNSVGFITSTNLFKNRLSITTKIRYYNIDNDNAYVDLRKWSNNQNFNANDPVFVGSISQFNYERKSDLGRNNIQAALDLRYRLSKSLSVFGGYSYEDVRRDFDQEYLTSKITVKNAFKIGASARPTRSLTARIKYEYQNTKNAFKNAHGICQKERDDLNQTTPTPYYQIFRNAYRKKDATNVPTDEHKIKFSATYTPSSKYSINFTSNYTNDRNDDSDWEGDIYTGGISIWSAPLQRLTLTLGYNYEWQKYETRAAVDLFGG